MKITGFIALIRRVYDLLSGYKTYLSAAGLAGLAAYQLSNGQFDQGIQSILAALAAAGLRHAVGKSKP